MHNGTTVGKFAAELKRGLINGAVSEINIHFSAPKEESKVRVETVHFFRIFLLLGSVKNISKFQTHTTTVVVLSVCGAIFLLIIAGIVYVSLNSSCFCSYLPFCPYKPY